MSIDALESHEQACVPDKELRTLPLGALLCSIHETPGDHEIRMIFPELGRGAILTPLQMNELLAWWKQYQWVHSPQWANPYLEKFQALHKLPDHAFNHRIEYADYRLELTRRYAWGVPGDQALDALQLLAPLVEIGAGKGYWASLLQSKGTDVLAFDACPPSALAGNPYCEAGTFTRVQRGSHTVAEQYPERTLFLCWPPENNEMASQTLRSYKGATVAYVGDPGCTGTNAFFTQLREDFTLVRTIPIPQYAGLQDQLWIYKRTPPPIKKPKR